MLQRPGQVRLVEIASLMNCLKNGLALFQESCGVAGAVDLIKGIVGKPGRLQETTLHRAYRHPDRVGL
jgi:hypothetical protein